MKTLISLAIAAGIIIAPTAAGAAAITAEEASQEARASRLVKKPSVLRWIKSGANGHMDTEGSGKRKLWCFEARNKTGHKVAVYASTSGPSRVKRTLKPGHWLIYCTDGWSEQQPTSALNFSR